MPEFLTLSECEQAGYLLYRDLVRRGWTDHLKRRFLGKPEKMINLKMRESGLCSHAGSCKHRAPRIGIWSRVRVEAVEATDEWQKAREKARRRKSMWRPPSGKNLSLDYLWSLNSGWKSSK